MINKNIEPITSSTKEDHIKQNINLRSFNIDKSDFNVIDSLNQGKVGSTCMTKYYQHDK